MPSKSQIGSEVEFTSSRRYSPPAPFPQPTRPATLRHSGPLPAPFPPNPQYHILYRIAQKTEHTLGPPKIAQNHYNSKRSFQKNRHNSTWLRPMQMGNQSPARVTLIELGVSKLTWGGSVGGESSHGPSTTRCHGHNVHHPQA